MHTAARRLLPLLLLALLPLGLPRHAVPSDGPQAAGPEGDGSSFSRLRRITVEAAPETTAADLEVLFDSQPQEVLQVQDPGDSWWLVLYFDPALSTPEGISSAAGALLAETDRLAALGEVEVVVADPYPEAFAGPTRDPDEIAEALELVADLAEGAGELLDRRGDFLDRGGDPAELLAEELDLVRVRREGLLEWLARDRPGGVRALFLAADGWDLAGGRFWGSESGGDAVLAREQSDLVGVLAAEGWTVLAPAAAGDLRELDPARSPLPELVAATGGRLLRSSPEIAPALAALAARRQVVYRARGAADGGVRPLAVRSRSGEALPAPRWASVATPPALALARARQVLEDPDAGGTLDLSALLLVGRAQAVAGPGAAPFELLLGTGGGSTRPPFDPHFRVTVVLAHLERPAEAFHFYQQGGDLGRADGWLYRGAVPLDEEPADVAMVLEDLRSGLWGATVAELSDVAFDLSDRRVVSRESFAFPDRAAPEPKPAAGASVLRLLPPRKRPAAGRVRFQVLTSISAIERVEFYLDGQRVSNDEQPPFGAAIDLGSEVAEHEVRAVGYGRGDLPMGEDSITINRSNRSFDVAIVGLDAGSGEAVAVEAEITTPPAARLDRVEFFRNEALAATLTAPPWRARLPGGPPAQGEFARVVAYLADGTSLEDAALLDGSALVERVEVNLVELDVMVSDRAGTPVRGLGADDFTVLVKGEEQPVERFGLADDVPLLLGLVIDTSESMWPLMPDTKRAGVQFLSSILRPEDRAFLVDFDTRPRLAQETTGEFIRLVRSFNALQAGGYTALFDAVVFSLVQFEEADGRKALVVLTDGDDVKSRFGTKRCIQYGRKLGVPIYVISLAAIQDSRRWNRRLDLESITEGTGGRVFYISAMSELPGAYGQIDDELRSQYVLAFSTDRPLEERELGDVKVTVTGRGRSVRAVVGRQRGG